jgi:outer membrane lipoprotein-sorting protein
MKTKLFTPIFFLSLFFIGQLSFVHAQTAQNIIGNLQRKYQSGQAIKASFNQTMTQNGRSKVAAGTIVMQQSKYRVETGDQTIVTDGRTNWAYSRSKRQVYVSNYAPDENAFSPQTFFMTQSQRFNIQKLADSNMAGAASYLLKLTPKTRDVSFREVYLWVRKSDSMPVGVKILDVNNITTQITLTNLQNNPRTDANTFRFATPSGVQTVDLR